jgi:excisionase family DNA binding protein
MLTSKQAAEKLGVHPETLRRMVRDGRLKAVHLGKGPRSKLRVEESEVQRFIDDGSTQTDEGC